MEFCIDAAQLRAALAEIEAAEKNGFLHCLAVFKFSHAGYMLSDCRATYSDLLERAHPTNASLDWGRFQGVSKRHTFKDGELVPLPAAGVPTPVPAAPFGTNVPELLAAADALLRTAPPEPDWVEEVRELLGEAYRFQSTSPKAQENINAALELIDRHTPGVDLPDGAQR